jgi:lipid A disaccharide synthetase
VDCFVDCSMPVSTQPLDILILSNGPGELTTWVRPVVKALRQQLAMPMRISLVLSPCPNASGREVTIAQSYPEIDRVQGAEAFWPFLLWGQAAADWDWAAHGIVIFLGGDQLFAAVIGKRLGYKTLVYAEWQTRWHRWVDQFAVMQPQVIEQAPPRYVEKLTVVGDLMADVGTQIRPDWNPESGVLKQALIGLLPGSKAAKLAQGVPLALAIATEVQRVYPQTRFVIPVAPTLDLRTLARFADPQQNPVLKLFGEVGAELKGVEVAEQDSEQPHLQPYLQTQQGLHIDLWTQAPAHDLLVQCNLCLTTVGANTAELGALAVPMIVLIPTQQLDAMRAWDGLPGLLANLPGVGTVFAKLINRWFIRYQRQRLLAWPNIWAGEAVVPELIGELQPQQVAEIVLKWLEHPEQLAQVRQRLQQVRGEAGAAQKLVQLVEALITA